MKHNLFMLIALVFISVLFVSSCEPKKAVDGSYDFIIYESDEDNTDLSDNPVVVKYHIEYLNCKTVTDTLIKKGSAYFFNEESPNYLIMKQSAYGLSYSEGYFQEYSECAAGDQIDVSWSYTAVNGKSAPKGIGETPLDDLKEYGFVINGWKNK